MATYSVTVISQAEFNTEIEASSEEEARKIAMDEWSECDISELEFWNSHICSIYEVEE